MKKPTLTFLILVFVIGWSFQGLAVMAGVNGAGHKWLVAAMWAPILSALLSGGESRRQVWTGLKRAGVRTWLMALFAGWSFSVLAQLMLWIAKSGSWNGDQFQLTADHHAIQSVNHLAMVLGVGRQGFGMFSFNLFLSVTLGSLILTLMGAVGEEAGWRGILQPHLARRFGNLQGTLFVGLIWGYWHIPVNLAGYNDAHHETLDALFLFPIEAVAMSFVLAWLVRRSGSIWPAAIAHAANNTLQSGPLVIPGGWSADKLTAIMASLIMGGLAAMLLNRQAVDAKNTSDETTAKPG